jgi:AraC-like DNA-binding protein
MPTAKLHITLPETTWIRTLSESYPDAQFRVLAALPADDDTGVGLVEVSAPDLPDVVGEMDDAEGILRLELLEASAESALVEFETTDPLLLLSVSESAVPLELPLTVQDGEAELDVTASRDSLSTLATQLETFGMSFDVEYVRELSDSEHLLTDRQRRLLDVAVEEGYYDSPRDCTLTELAEEVGVAKSTASETLHRAEGKIIKQYVTGERSGYTNG